MFREALLGLVFGLKVAYFMKEAYNTAIISLVDSRNQIETFGTKKEQHDTAFYYSSSLHSICILCTSRQDGTTRHRFLGCYQVKDVWRAIALWRGNSAYE